MWAQADGDKEPQKEEDEGLNPLKKMLASFDDADSGQGNSPMERAGGERVAQCVNAASLNNNPTYTATFFAFAPPTAISLLCTIFREHLAGS
jgi:hypothetical protein